MKKVFGFGCLFLFLFEIANVYFIMPMPGSQRMNSIELAYFLHRWRWVFRAFFGFMILAGLVRADWKRKWVPVIPLLLLGAVIYLVNFKMAADVMFSQPGQISTVGADKNKVDSNRLVIGVVINGKAKAYPIRFLGYHHHIQDELGGRKILVTYCTVCRTGRVYEPVVNGKYETFRLVGMDQFNAMLEDHGTKSWWQQATGRAVSGKLKGQQLPELNSTQTTLAKWLSLYPSSQVLQADPSFEKSYPNDTQYEDGSSRKTLTGTDSLSWKDKSWIVGITVNGDTKAYDWNRLKREKLIQDDLGGKAILLLLSDDNRSFFAFEKTGTEPVTFQQDTLLIGTKRYSLDGRGVDTAHVLNPITAYQEFWHSWRTFHPGTKKY